MKYIVTLFLIIVLLLTLSSCSLWYDHENNAVGFFNVGYSESLNDAFIGAYNWDGTDEGMNITIPKYYNNIKIKELGGYCGRGVPTPFEILPAEEARNILCPNATEWSRVAHTATIVASSVQYLNFTVNISKYIQEIENLDAGGIIVAEYVENGETKYNVYVLTCYITCDEDNKTFYAKDGKLYLRDGDVLVEDIIYEDFDLEAHNEKYKDETAWWYPFARK